MYLNKFNKLYSLLFMVHPELVLRVLCKYVHIQLKEILEIA